MNDIVTLVVAVGIALLVLRIFFGVNSEKKFKQMRETLNVPHKPDYVYEGFFANRVGEPNVRVVLAIYRSAGQIRFILDRPKRDIRMDFDDIVEVSEGKYEVVGKVRDEVSIITRHRDLPSVRIQAWGRELYVNLRSATG